MRDILIYDVGHRKGLKTSHLQKLKTSATFIYNTSVGFKGQVYLVMLDLKNRNRTINCSNSREIPFRERGDLHRSTINIIPE